MKYSQVIQYIIFNSSGISQVRKHWQLSLAWQQHIHPMHLLPSQDGCVLLLQLSCTLYCIKNKFHFRIIELGNTKARKANNICLLFATAKLSCMTVGLLVFSLRDGLCSRGYRETGKKWLEKNWCTVDRLLFKVLQQVKSITNNISLFQFTTHVLIIRLHCLQKRYLL